MKICLINNLYKPFNRGGAEKITQTMANGLLRAGHKVFIITAKPHKRLSITNYQSPPDAKAAKDKRIYYLNSLYYNLNKLPKSLRLFWHVWDMFDVVSYFKIKNILSREKPDAVITGNLMGLGYLTIRAVKKLKIKLIHVVHDIQLIHPAGLIFYGQENIIESASAKNYAGLMSRLLDSPEVVIFPSKWLRDIHLKKIFFIRSQRLILANPVEAPLAAAKAKTGRVFKFLFLGQIEEHKGIFLLLNAFKKLAEKYQEAELIIAGDGSLMAAAGKAANGQGNINFLGWPGDEAVDELLSSVDCLVYPSLVYENCPNAIQRALAAGLPVLASDLGGIPELLSQNAGVLFKPADTDDLEDKMEWFINNRYGLGGIIEAGKKRAALYAADNYIKELENLIK